MERQYVPEVEERPRLFDRGEAGAAAFAGAPATTSGWNSARGDTGSTRHRPARPYENRMDDPTATPEAVPPTTYAELARRMALLEDTEKRRTKEIDGYRNQLALLEDDVHQLSSDTAGAVREEYHRDMEEMATELTKHVGKQLDDFHRTTVTPLELELREIRHNIVAPLKLTVERALLDYESRLDQALHSFERTQASLQTQIDQNSALAAQNHQELHAEQQEHAEAIGTVMDLLVSTATQESLEQVSSELQAVVEEQAGHMDESLTKVDDVLREIEERLKAAETGFAMFQEESAAAIESKVTEVGDALAAETSAALQDSADQLTHLQRAVELSLQDVKASTASLEKQLQEHVGTYGQRLTEVEHINSQTHESVNAHGGTVLKLSAKVDALDAKLESTSQVLDQKVELTAEEMDRQLAATKMSLETSLAKAARETTDRIDSGDKSGLSALAEVRQGLSVQVDTLKQRMAEFETGAATQAEKDISALRDRLNADVKEMRTSLNDKTSATAAKVDQKLESTLKQVADLAGNSKLAIQTIEESVSGLRADMDERHRETGEMLSSLRKEATELIEKDVASLTQLIDMKHAHFQTEQKRETADRVTSMKDFKATFTREISTISSRVDEQHGTFSEMTANQERLFTDKATALDAMVADHHAHFSGVCSAMEQRFIDKTAAVTARTEDLSNTVNMHHHSLNSLCTSMETKNADRMQHFDRQLENTRSSFAESCAKLDTKLAEQKQKLNDTLNDRVKKLSEDIQGTRTHLSERQAQDLDHFQQRVQEFEEKMRHKQLANETRVDGVLASLQTTDKKCDRLDGSITQVSNALKDNRDTFTKMCAGLQKKLEAGLSTQQSGAQDLRNTVTAHYETFNGMCGDADAKIKVVSSELEQLKMIGHDQNQQLTENLQAMNMRMRDELRLLTDSTTHLDAKLGDTKTDFESKLKGQYSHFTEMHNNLDSKMMERTGAVEARMKDAQATLSDRVNTIEMQSKEKDTEHDQRFAVMTDLVLEKAQEAAELSQSLKKQAVADLDKNEERAAGIAEELRETKRELLQVQGAQQKQIEENRRLQDEQAAEVTEKVSRVTERIDKRIGKLQTFVEERVSAVQTSLSEDRELSRVATAKLDKKHTDRVNDVETRSQTVQRKLGADLANLTKKTDDFARKLETNLTEVSEEVRTELKSLANTVGANHKAATSATDEVNRKFTEIFALAEERMTKQRDGMTDMLDQTKATLKSQQDALQTALNGQHEHFTLQLGEMDIKFSEIGSSLEAELASMSAMQQAQNDSFTKVCEGIVDFAKEENAAQDKRAMKTFQDFDDACASLDRKFSEAVQRQDERMDDLRGALNSTDLKMDEKNSSQDERVDELNDALEALTQQVADSTSTTHTATQSVASKLSDVTADLTGSIKTGLQALNQRIDRVEAAQSSETEMSRAKIEAETVERTSAIESLELKINSETGRLDSAVDALQSLVPVEVQRLESKLGAEVTGLKHQFDGESERVDRAIEEKTHDLSTRLTNGVGSLTMQLDATDSKFTTRIAAESQSIATKLQNSTDSLDRRLTNETKDLRDALREQSTRLDAAQKASASSFSIRVDQEVMQLKTEISDSAGRQEARSVSVEQAAERALTETNARLERKLEEATRDLKATDNKLKSDLALEKKDVGVALRGLGKSVDEVESARKTLDTRVETMRMEIAQEIVTKTRELEQAIGKADAEAQSRDAVQNARVLKLESEVSGKLASEISSLEGKMKTELSPLTIKAERLERKIEAVEQLATRADVAAQNIDMRVNLQDMSLKEVESSIKHLGDESETLEQTVEKVEEDVADLTTDVVLLQTSLMAAEPAR